MKKIFAISWKDALVRFSSRSEILFFLILPIAFTLILSKANAPESESLDNRVPLLVVDEDQGTAAAALQDELSASNTVRLEQLSAEEAEERFSGGDAPALLTIPAGFSQQLNAGQTADLELQTAVDDLDAGIAAQAVAAAAAVTGQPYQAAQTAVTQLDSLGFVAAGERAALFQTSLQNAREAGRDQETRVQITQPPQANAAGETYDPVAHMSIGQLVTWVFIPLLGVSGLFVYERTGGTLSRLLTTPTRKYTSLLGTITGQFTLGLVQMAILVGFGVLFLQVNWGQSPVGLVVMLVSFGLAAVAMGTTLGTFVRTMGQASNLSIMAGMAMALLGGAWFPIELFPPAMQTAAKVLPTTWAMQGLTDLVVRGQGLVEVLPEAGVLCGFALVFFVLGTLRFRFE